MSEIRYHTNNSIIYSYHEILEDKINKVCDKIGFNDSDVTWFIFNPNELKCVDSRIPGQIIKYIYRGMDYGFCDLKKKEIWISTAAIMRDYFQSLPNKMYSSFGLSRSTEPDFLADVIIDEITHIQTGCDHGDQSYDMKLRENAIKYYIPLIERLWVKR